MTLIMAISPGLSTLQANWRVFMRDQLDQPRRAVLKDWYMYIKARLIAQFDQLWSVRVVGIFRSAWFR